MMIGENTYKPKKSKLTHYVELNDKHVIAGCTAVVQASDSITASM